MNSIYSQGWADEQRRKRHRRARVQRAVFLLGLTVFVGVLVWLGVASLGPVVEHIYTPLGD